MRNPLSHQFAFLLMVLSMLCSGLHAQTLVISQVYGGAGCLTAGCSSYQNDYIEIFNAGNSPVGLLGKSVQYSSSGGSTWQITPLPDYTLAPGQYFLIAEAYSSNGINALPTPDASGSITISSSSGRVAIASTTSSLPGSCASGGSVIDLVGYGSSSCSEGANAPAPSATNAIFRLKGGCQDIQNNFSDFEALLAAPRNSSAAFKNCYTNYISINNVSLSEGNAGTTNFNFTVSLNNPAGAGGVSFSIATADGTATAGSDYVQKSLSNQTIAAGNTQYTFTVAVNGDISFEANESFYVNISNVINAEVSDGQGLGTILNDDISTTPIHDIQGSGNLSPLVSQSVITRGIVTGLKSNGFFLQDPNPDADPNTSEGIFVFTSFAPPAAASIGNLVQVTATVLEFTPGNDLYSPSLTELTGPTVSVLSTGNALPSAIVLSAADLQNNNLYNLEKYEGMRVQVNSLTVSGATQGTIDEVNAAVNSTGYFYGVITGTARPFREPGIALPDSLPAGAPATIPRWDANPELIAVDSKVQPGATALNVAVGAILTNLTGPLDYIRRYYTIDVDAGINPGISNNNLAATTLPAIPADQVSIASLNVQRFFDAVDDPGFTEPVLTNTAYNNRLNKASLAVRNVLNYPDVIGMQEVENLATLQAIANKINNDAVAQAAPNPHYQPYLIEGNDIGGIDVGFLVKSNKIVVASVQQMGKSATYLNPVNSSQETLFDRPPLVLKASFTKPGCGTPFPFTVIVNHFLALANLSDPTNGPRVRAKRKAQAEYMANLLQTKQLADASERIICLGDFNAFQFNDGYVDVMGTITGNPATADKVVTASSDLVNPNLVNLDDVIGASQRYSYSFQGSAQTLDHILVSQNISGQVAHYDIARIGADFPQVLYTDNTRPEKLTDHDAPVMFLGFTCATPSLASDYFRTKTSGNWNSTASWESSADSVNWHAATLTPDFNANSITILNGHAIAVSANLVVDQLVIQPGSSLSVNPGIIFTIQKP